MPDPKSPSPPAQPPAAPAEKSPSAMLAERRARLQRRPAPFKDNPATDEAYAALQDDGQRFRVGSHVGGHAPGSVIAATQLPRGAQINRLVKIGALIPMSKDESEEHILAVELPALEAETAGPESTLVEGEQGRFDPANATGSPSGPAPKTAEPVPPSLTIQQGEQTKTQK